MAVRRKCKVVESGFGRRVNMFDVDCDLLTPTGVETLDFSLSALGTDLELSECERVFFWARIWRERALRKLFCVLGVDVLTANGAGFAGVVCRDLRLSRGELIVLLVDRRLLSVAIDDGVDEVTDGD